MRAHQFSVEVARAVAWLTENLLPGDSPNASVLADALTLEFEQHYKGHWYPSEAHRGCAYRSLTCNIKLDPLILRALDRANIDRENIRQKEHVFILWINPGEVKLNEAGVTRHIFCKGDRPNPYSKPKVLVEPTKLNVSVDDTDSRPSSSNASSASESPVASPKPTPKRSMNPTKLKLSLSPSAPNFVPRSGVQSSSQSCDSDSEGEQPAPVLAQAVAFAPLPPQPPPPGLFVPGWQMAPQQPTWATAGAGWQQHQQTPYNPYAAVEAH